MRATTHVFLVQELVVFPQGEPILGGNLVHQIIYNEKIRTSVDRDMKSNIRL